MIDNNIYEKNILALRKYYADYAEYFSKEETKNSQLDAWINNIDGKNILMLEYEGVNYQLESLYDNKLFVDTMFKHIDDTWELNGKMFFFGIGNGMYARDFLDKFSEDHKLMIYEPCEEIFRTVIKYYDLTDIFTSDRVYLYIDYEDNTDRYDMYLGRYLDYTDIFSFKYRIYLNYGTLFKEKANNWITMINDALNVVNADHILYMRFGEKFLDNNYKNLKYFATSHKLTELADIVPEEIPAIIVSAGPSLSKNIHDLKKAEGHAIIIALDASVNPLARAGIKPDIMIAIDPTKGEKYLTEPGTENVPLVCDLNTASGFLSTQKSLKFFTCGMNLYVNEFLTDHKIEMTALAAGGSVANSAFSFARYIGCKKIILVGQDLAFTGDKTHVEGSVRGKEGKEFINDSIKYKIVEEDINGEPVLSCAEYRSFRLWFESQIKLYKEIRVVDATEGGAKIHGSDIMTLNDAIAELCQEDYDFGGVLNGISMLFTDEQREEFADHMLNIVNRIEINEKKIKEAREIYAKMRRLVRNKKAESQEMVKTARKVNKIVDEIQADTAMSSMKDIARKEIGEILGKVYKMEEGVDNEILSVCDIGEEYLDLIESSAKKYKKMHNKYVEEGIF